MTGKVDRLQLQAQLDTLLQRELTYEEQKRWIQRQMLRAYCSWYPVALLYLVWATLVGGFLDLKSLWSIPLRLLLLPYMWGALAYTPLLPLSSKRERAAYESCICPPELLLILVGVLPSFLLCTAQVWACALLVCVRREPWNSINDQFKTNPSQTLHVWHMPTLTSVAQTTPFVV